MLQPNERPHSGAFTPGVPTPTSESETQTGEKSGDNHSAPAESAERDDVRLMPDATGHLCKHKRDASGRWQPLAGSGARHPNAGSQDRAISLTRSRARGARWSTVAILGVVCAISGLAAFPLLSTTESANSPTANAGAEDPRTSVAELFAPDGSATGFLVAEHLLATGAQFLEERDPTELRIRFPQHHTLANFDFELKLHYIDRDRGVALLTIDADAPSLPFARLRGQAKGVESTLLGNTNHDPSSKAPLETLSAMVERESTRQGRPVYRLGFFTVPSMLGGPLVAKNGQVLAMSLGASKGTPHETSFLPIEEVEAALADCSTLSKRAHETIEATHRLRVYVARLLQAGDYLAATGRATALAMRKALERDQDPAAARARVQGSLANSIRKAEAALARIPSGLSQDLLTNAALPEDLRTDYFRLKKAVNEMQRHVLQPRGTVNSHRREGKKLSEQYRRLAASLSLSLGL